GRTHSLMHRGIKDLDAAAPELLGPVESGVGVAQKIPRAVVACRAENQADADRGVDIAPFEDHRGEELLPNALGEADGIRNVAECVHQDRELVPTEARHRVLRAHQVLELLRDGEQEAVPRLVSETIVDALEMITVEQQQGGALSSRGGPE